MVVQRLAQLAASVLRQSIIDICAWR
jgi:hypothetical protein